MSRRQVITLVAVGVIVIVGVLAAIFTGKNGTLAPEREQTGGQTPGAPGEVGDTPAPVFTNEVPANAEPTKAEFEAPAAAGAEEKFGAFNMTVNSAGFTPNSITVTKGDAVQIRLTAQGGDYDFQMPYKGLYVMVPEGETKNITFGINTAGTYLFQCRDSCPSGRVISGSLIVLP